MKRCKDCSEHKLCEPCQQKDAAISLWAANGIIAIQAYPAKHAAFANYLLHHSHQN